MILLPAIDLYEGKAVRLYKGDYSRMTVYSDDPLAVARDFQSCGATWVHMVDLEGARSGDTPHLELVARIAEESGLHVEIGGGIRDLKTVRKYLERGAARVILGTAAVEDRDLLRRAVESCGEKIAVGADVRDGMVAIRGWQVSSACTLEDFLAQVQEIGVKTVICTDISRDGAMQGANRPLYGELSRRYAMDLVASGGVSSLEDIRALRELGLYGAIVGKAYYTGTMDLREAVKAAI